MKAITLLVFFFLTSVVYRQNDTSIAGTWKIISIDTDGVYYNFEKDSISLSNANKTLYTDSAELEKLSNRIILIYSTLKFQFGQDGNFRQTISGNIMIEGTYQTIVSQKRIGITTKNSSMKMLRI